jgi:hypothetical protein
MAMAWGKRQFPGPVGSPSACRPCPPSLNFRWFTRSKRNPKPLEQAGVTGCRLLTHLLGQTTHELARKAAFLP